MLATSVKDRTLNAPGVSTEEVDEAINGLLAGQKVVNLPTRLCKSVISTLTQMRKQALLANKDKLADKMDEILGELKYGPNGYNHTTAQDPAVVRGRSLK